MSEFETVHTMTDFYDGPRKGVADVNGLPHLYVSEFSDLLNNYTGKFHLTPVSQELLELAMESWQIYLRWREAMKKGESNQDEHPALPSERARSDELEEILEKRLVIDPNDFLIATAEFRNRDAILEVRWTIESN